MLGVFSYFTTREAFKGLKIKVKIYADTKLTNDTQVNESFSFSMFVLDDYLVTAFVRLLGVLESILCAVCRGVDLVFGQTLVVVEPVCISLRVGAVGDSHNDGLPCINHVALVSGFDLRHSWGMRRDGVTKTQKGVG